MKSLLVKLSAIALLTAGFNSMPLFAQDREAEGPVPTQSDANNPDSKVYRVSDVINLPVKNDEGAEVGRIKDLVINGESREVLYAVVAMNDAKQKDSLYVMPWTVFQPSYGPRNSIQYAMLGLPQTVWMQAPFFSAAQWQQAPFSQWGPRVNTYYADHIAAARTANSASVPVRANKPILSDDNSKTSNPPKTTKAPAKTGEKPEDPANVEKPAVKPKSQPAKPEAPLVKDAEPPKAKTPKLPAPKNPDPADPKIPAPKPQEPKTPAPAPK